MPNHPVNIELVPDARIARWRPFVHWLLAIPAMIWMTVLGYGAVAVAFLGWFSILFTGKLPQRWGDYLVAVQRYRWRVSAFTAFMITRHPGFRPVAGYVDPGDRPTIVYSARPVARSRLTVFFRLILAIPHLIALVFVGIAVLVVMIVSWFAVVILGRWPEELRAFYVGYVRWSIRLAAYLTLIVDTYPPFGFEE